MQRICSAAYCVKEGSAPQKMQRICSAPSEVSLLSAGFWWLEVGQKKAASAQGDQFQANRGTSSAFEHLDRAEGRVARQRHLTEATRRNPMIRKLKTGQYRLYSRKINPKTGKRRNLGTFDTRDQAVQHEREVQFFKRRA